MFYIVEVDNEGFKILDSSGTEIDPAEDATVAAITTELQAIQATTGIKAIIDPLPAGTNNIGDVDIASALPAGSNILGLMKLVDTGGVNVLAIDGSGRIAIQDPPNLDVALSTRATEATLATLATEAKLEAVRALLATIDADTSNIDTTLSSRATEATVATLATEAKLEAVRVLLASLDGKDYATQTTLASILVDTGQIEALLATIDADTSVLAAVDYATETTLSAADTKLGTIDAVLDSIKDTDGIKKITDGVQLQASTNNIGNVKIVDGENGVRTAYVDGSNRLVVSSNATIVPPASVAVEIEEQSDLSGTDDNVYTITNSTVLTISRFAGGSEGNSGKASKAELYYDPNGNGVGMTLLRTMYLSGTNYEFTLDLNFTGDGTAAVRMRRERLDGGSDEVSAFWNGFET